MQYAFVCAFWSIILNLIHFGQWNSMCFSSLWARPIVSTIQTCLLMRSQTNQFLGVNISTTNQISSRFEDSQTNIQSNFTISFFLSCSAVLLRYLFNVIQEQNKLLDRWITANERLIVNAYTRQKPMYRWTSNQTNEAINENYSRVLADFKRWRNGIEHVQHTSRIMRRKFMLLQISNIWTASFWFYTEEVVATLSFTFFEYQCPVIWSCCFFFFWSDDVLTNFEFTIID